MLEAIEKRLIEELLEINRTFYRFDFSKHDVTQPYPYFVETYEWILKNKEYLKALLSDNGNILFARKWKKYISDYFLEAFSYNGAHFSSPDVIAVIVSSALMDIIIYWLNSREDLTPSDLSIISGKMIHGILDKFRC